MTREAAEDLVQDLIYAVRTDERSWSGTRGMAMKEVKRMKEAVIEALVTPTPHRQETGEKP